MQSRSYLTDIPEVLEIEVNLKSPGMTRRISRTNRLHVGHYRDGYSVGGYTIRREHLHMIETACELARTSRGEGVVGSYSTPSGAQIEIGYHAGAVWLRTVLQGEPKRKTILDGDQVAALERCLQALGAS